MSWGEAFALLGLALVVWTLLAIPLAIVVGKRLRLMQPPPMSTRDSESLCDDSTQVTEGAKNE